MNHNELLKKIADETGYSKVCVTEVLDAFYDLAKESLINEQEFKILNICKLVPVPPKPKKHYDINNKEWKMIIQKFKLKIKTSEELQEAYENRGEC